MLELIDDRGHRHPVTPDALHHRDPALKTDLMTGPRVGYIVVTGGVLALGAIGLTHGRLGASSWLGGLFVAAGLLVAWTVERACSRFTWWYGRGVLAWHARSVVRLGKCPVCWYALRSLTPDPDGCTACPECGAAWRLPPAKPPPPRQSP